jgi:hypothetical protein
MAITLNDTKTRIYNLYIEQLEAEEEKKATSKMHSENIKRIKSEIKDILNEEAEVVKNAQKSIDD